MTETSEVRAGFILKDIPALIAKHLDSPEVNSTGSEYTITLSNLEQTKSITLVFDIETTNSRKSVIFGVSKSLDESTT